MKKIKLPSTSDLVLAAASATGKVSKAGKPSQTRSASRGESDSAAAATRAADSDSTKGPTTAADTSSRAYRRETAASADSLQTDSRVAAASAPATSPNPASRRETATSADSLQRIGIPRALLYYRYGPLWTTFLTELGREVVLSRPTDRGTVERGGQLSNDECCLASKIYMGHVDELVGRCDAVFVPCLDNVGLFRDFCTKFQALPDLVRNTFYEQNLQVVSCLVNKRFEKCGLRDGMLELGENLGATPREAKRAWRAAIHAQDAAEREAVAAQQRVLADRPDDGITILLAAHPYLAHDPYMGGAIADMAANLGVTLLHTDRFDRKTALKRSAEFSDTLPWVVNREIVGAIMALHDKVDGILLVSAFPCGPDSMTDDAIIRCIQGKPILNLTVDAQTGTAGLETRIESFVDILRYQKKGGYVHE